MSVFKRPGGEVYYFDFQFRGRRFSGPTGCTEKREAQRHEKAVRDEAQSAEIDTTKPLNFSQAASQYWHEVGQFHSDPSGPERNLAWLVQHIGKSTMISAIDDSLVARLVASRRGEGVANGTVNRTVVEPLRTVMNRASDVWKAKVQRINWRTHRLKEPQERVREATAEEQAAIIAAVPADYTPAILFAIQTGCRRAEIVGLRWTDVNFFAREFRVTGKGDLTRTIPMTKAVYALLWEIRHHHAEAVFSFKAERTRDGRVRGQRYPITAEGMNTVWARHVRPKIKDFRFHDTRHTAATRLVRATGNLKLAQRLLGHSNITTTARYSHVTHDDLRAGMEVSHAAQSPTGNGTKSTPAAEKALK